MLRTIEELQALTTKLAQFDDPIGFDIETGYDGESKEKAALHPEIGFITGFSISGDPSWARYVPLRHQLVENVDVEAAIASLAPLSGRFVAHNTKFERRFLRHVGHDLQFRSDTLVEAYVLSNWQSNALKYLTKAVLGHEQAEIDSLFPKMNAKQRKSLRFNELELTPEVISYACEDAALCLELHNKHYPLVHDNFIYKLEMSIQTLLCEMEEYGVLWDWSLMHKSAGECEIFMREVEKEIMAELSALVGTTVQINLGSPQQIAKVLFDELGMVGQQKTKKGAYSTNAVSMAAMSKKYPVVRKILNWKELRTLLTRYLAKWPLVYSYAPDGRAHSNHMQCAVGTGRFAVDDPPYQQTPKKYHYELNDGREFNLNFRLAVTCAPDHYLFHFDYSQVELRAIAGVAQEPTLLEAFAKGQDVHVATAALMLQVARENVTEDMRDVGKTMNFALMYQMGPSSLADRLAISRDRARELYDSYFSSYSAIAAFVERAKELGKQTGYAQTYFGRKFTIWELQSSDMRIYSKGERVAVNAPIQGWAADYMKIAMSRERKAREKAGLLDTAHLIMNNHDALTYEVHNSVSPQTMIDVLLPAVCFPIEGFPPIVAEWNVGATWGTLKKLPLDANNQIIQDAPLQLPDNDDPFAALEDEEDEDGVVKPIALNLEGFVDMKEKTRITLEQLPSDVIHGPYGDDAVEHALAAQSISPSATPADISSEVGGEVFATPGGPQRIIVELTDLPDEYTVDRFASKLQERPGENIIVLRTSQGDLPWEAWPTSIGMQDAPTLKLLFKAGAVYLDSSSVDISMLDGISL